jgi:hypothetical protein
MALRNSTDIIKGSSIQVWLGDGTNYECVGFATNHTLNVTQNFQTINCKDAGDYELQLPTTTSWTVGCEYLMSNDGFAAILRAKQARKPVTLIFGTATNYSNTQLQNGIIDNDATNNWAYNTTGPEGVFPTGATGTVLTMKGNAYVGDYSINAPAGENATMTVNFQGSGELAPITGTVIPLVN